MDVKDALFANVPNPTTRDMLCNTVQSTWALEKVG